MEFIMKFNLFFLNMLLLAVCFELQGSLTARLNQAESLDDLYNNGSICSLVGLAGREINRHNLRQDTLPIEMVLLLRVLIEKDYASLVSVTTSSSSDSNEKINRLKYFITNKIKIQEFRLGNVTSPLMLAVSVNSLPVVTALLESGARVTGGDDPSDDPLKLAISKRAFYKTGRHFGEAWRSYLEKHNHDNETIIDLLEEASGKGSQCPCLLL
jgi:hypothetical protein